MRGLRYYENCIHYPNIDELECIIDNDEEISYNEFKSNVNDTDLENLTILFGYNEIPLKIEDDWSVSFHKSKDCEGNTVYFLKHSGIEYVFKEEGMGCEIFNPFFSNGGLAKGIEVEKEHKDLYEYFKRDYKKRGLKMPVSEDKFYEMIAKAHLKESKDYYKFLEEMEKNFEPETKKDNIFVRALSIKHIVSKWLN